MNHTLSTTQRDQIQATGLVYFKAVVDHAIEHGLTAPITLELTDRAIRVWVRDGKEQWGESIHIDSLDTRPSPIPDRIIVHINGRLPFMNLPIQLVFAQDQKGAQLTVVQP